MKKLIKSIRLTTPAPITLPDGVYDGTWSGYAVELTHEGVGYTVAIDDGVRGTVPCRLTIYGAGLLYSVEG